MNRRLAAMVFYDVAGFSRAIGTAETATIAALTHHRSRIIEPLAARFDGRLVKLMGDGGLIEFPSAVDAVRFSVSMQNAVSSANRAAPDARQLCYRIGINIGDVVVDGGDLLGEGVNIAARLEGIADPGGICIHRNVRSQVKNKLALDFQDLGSVPLKNIAAPVPAFRVVMNSKAAALAAAPGPGAAVPPRPPRLRRAAAAAVAALVLLLGLGWWQPWVPPVETASVARMAYPLPDKPSLAVLPFMDMSEDQGQTHFADGIAEDLITDLSRISGLFVVARNSTFVYKGQSVNIAQTAEDLGVRYIVEGSVRRAGGRVRVNAQLIDATTGGHVWAGRFDGKTADVFAVQDEFVRKIAKALAVSLTEEEKQEIALGQTSSLQARAVFQEGWERYLAYSARDNAAAIQHFTKALEIDPEYGRAHAALGLAYLRGCQQRWHKPLGMSAGEAFAKAQNALAETKTRPSSLANVAASRINLYNERYSVAQAEATRAIAKDPNDPEGYVAMAWAMITTGQPDAGLELMDRAIRLNPSHPNYYVLASAMAHYTLGDLDRSAGLLATALERAPDAIELAAVAASIHAQTGDQQKAHAAMKLWLPEASPKELSAAPFAYHFPYNWMQRPEIVKNIVDGLHMAALPPGDPIGTLAARLGTGDKASRIRAARVLGIFGPRAADAVPSLIAALDDEYTSVRKAAAMALGDIGPAASAALPALTALTDQPVIGVRAQKAIEKIRE